MGIISYFQNNFYRMLAISSLAVFGVMINGYPLLPAVAFFIIVVIALFPRLRDKVSLSGVIKFNAHLTLFCLLMAYLVFQSMRGAIADWRVLFFVLLFSSLLITAVMVVRNKILESNLTDIPRVIFFSGSIWFLLYLLQGLFLVAFGLDRYSTQGIYFSGSSYAFFPLVLVLPSGLNILSMSTRFGSKRGYVHIWLMLSVISFTGGFYNSRIAFIAIGIFCLSMFLMLGWRKVALLSITVLTFYFLGMGTGGNSWIIRNFGLNDLLGSYTRPMYDLYNLATSSLTSATATSDYDRVLPLQAAVDVAARDMFSFLFGYGFYSHKHELLDVVYRYYNQFGIVPTSNIGVIRTTTFAALLVDTGLLGISLLAANFYFCGREIMKASSSLRIAIPMLLFLSLIPFWLFVTNVSMAVCLYLAIMPRGLFYRITEWQYRDKAYKSGCSN